MNKIIIDDKFIERIKSFKNDLYTRAAQRWKGEDLSKPTDKAKKDFMFRVLQSLVL